MHPTKPSGAFFLLFITPVKELKLLFLCLNVKSLNNKTMKTHVIGTETPGLLSTKATYWLAGAMTIVCSLLILTF